MRRTFRVLIAIIIGASLWAPSEARADVCTLSAQGTSCGPAGSGTTDPTFNAGGALFYEMNYQPTGSGVIDPFVRVRAGGVDPDPPEGIESGYNTGGTLEFETIAGIHTHPIQLQDIPTVTIGTTQYREFLLDINEPVNGTKKFLSLDEVQIFLSPNPDLTGYNHTTDQLAGLNAVYNLDSGADNWISLNYNLNRGSGSGDMIMYIPESFFAGASPTSYLYLYSGFGLNWGAGDGYEEWWVDRSHLTNPPDVQTPEPGTALLLGFGLVLAARRVRRTRTTR